MHYDVLGPLVVSGPDGAVAVPPRSASLVCWLVAYAGHPLPWVSLGSLLWPGQAEPESGSKARAAARDVVPLLGGDVEHNDLHIALRVEPDRVDAHRFTTLLDRAEASTDPARIGDDLREALAMWRGEPYRELQRAVAALPFVESLLERHHGALEDLLGLRLAGPVDYRLVADLRAEVTRRPERPRLWRQLALALYRTGRQVEALEVLMPRQAEDEQATALRTAILRHDPGLDRGELPAAG